MASVSTVKAIPPLTRPRRVRLFRFFSRPIFRWLFRLLAHPTVAGLENVPPKGPYLITANHLAVADPPMVLAFWPYAVEALGAANMMQAHFSGFIMRGYGTYAVQRDSFDRSALKAALHVLQAGRALFIAPEGTRSPKGMGTARPGAAYLVIKTEVPIVPVGLTGTERMFSTLRHGRREPIHMQIGEPYELPPVRLTGDNRHAVLQEYTIEIMRRIAALLPLEYRGAYAAYV